MAVLIVGLPSLVAFQESDKPGLYDIDVNLDFRSIQQGEIVRVSVVGKGVLKQAEVLFLGKTYIMVKGQDPDNWIAFLGLDLGIKSGTYTIEVSVLFNDGYHQNIKREILVQN